MATRTKSAPKAPARTGAPEVSTADSKRVKAVTDKQLDVHAQNVTNVPDRVDEVAVGATRGGKDKEIHVEAVGGEVIVTVGAQKVYLDREGMHQLQRKVSQAAATL